MLVETSVHAQASGDAKPAEPSATDVLRKLMPVLICKHEHTRGGNDYISCDDCGFEWDYTKRTAQLAVVAMNNDIAALLADPAVPQAPADVGPTNAAAEPVVRRCNEPVMRDPEEPFVDEECPDNETNRQD